MRAWNHSPLTELLGLRHPIVQGPFGGGLSSATLVAAVSNAGGLGSYGAHLLSGHEIRSLAEEIRRLTPRPFNLNLWVPLPGECEFQLSPEAFSAEAQALRPLRERFGLPDPVPPSRFAPASFDEQLEALLDVRPAVASFVFGAPSRDIMRELQARGIHVFLAATTVDEALHGEAAGADVIVASGSDAGGHRPSFLRPAEESLVGTLSLVPQIVDAVRVPVIAAGGIADGRGIIAARALGAAGVQVGTAFLACHEANASEGHKRAITSAGHHRTTLTRAYTGRLARGIRNDLLDTLEQVAPEPPPYPVRSWFVSPLTRAAIAKEQPAWQSLWAGQAAPLARRLPAAERLASLVREADQAARFA